MPEFSWINESLQKNRSIDWFWAIGVIAIGGAITCFIVGNILFGIFIILAGSLLFYTNTRHSADQRVLISEKEINVDGLSYQSKKMRGFAIVKNHKDENILIVRTNRIFMPMLILPVDDGIPLDELEETLEKNILKEELHEPPANVMAEKLGF